jgi:hypothetical protein
MAGKFPPWQRLVERQRLNVEKWVRRDSEGRCLSVEQEEQ